MTNRLLEIEPSEIEHESFRIIEQEFFARTSIDPSSYENPTFQVIRRVIHATGDFSFANHLVFHPEAIKSGIKAIQKGKNIYCDVSMAEAGVSKKMFSKYGGRVICHINDNEIANIAARDGKTRSECALEKIQGENVGIIAVGNAPTALVKAMQMIDDKSIAPDLVVGVPVGFVNAQESKEILKEKLYPFVTSTGRKGGTPVAVAIVNALIRLA